VKAKTKPMVAGCFDLAVKITEISATTIVVVPHGATVVGKKPSIA
jgi:hypothetical protein